MMFESFMLDDTCFYLQKNHYSSVRWRHPDGLFSIKQQNNLWNCRLTINSSNFGKELSVAEIHSITSKEFTTLKEARSNVLQTFSPYLTQQKYQMLSKALIQNRDAVYHDVVTDVYPFCKRDSPLYLIGRAGVWFLRSDIDINFSSLEHESFQNIFSKPFTTRKQGIAELKHQISLHLPEFYNLTTPEKYLESKKIYQEIVSNHNCEDPHNNWWIMFVKPEIHLNEVF